MQSILVILIVLFCTISSGQLLGDKPCFCKLSGAVHECACTVDSVDEFNYRKLFPVLQNLLQKNFFRYYQVNMDKKCPFWEEERECSSKECGIENCDDEVPAGLKTGRPNHSSEVFLEKSNQPQGPCDASNQLDPLDKTISNWQKQQFGVWAKHDDAEDKYCDVDDEDSATMHYVDLQRNPERYTGYKGNSAVRVWKCIYEENCFKPDPKFDKNFLLHPTVTGLCLEKRVFYRLISGLHTSITISIAAHNYKPAPHGFGQGQWVRNMEMFKNRFSPELTNGEGPERLKNLYFVYLMELRALQKVAPYLKQQSFYTGNDQDDQDTRLAVDQLIDLIDSFPDHFDESPMFQGYEARARALKEEFRRHFVNISSIMDCVNCDKCRLWGKLQTHGIGTALKILFAQNLPFVASTGNVQNLNNKKFQLQRNDVVALLNSLGRFASSIGEVNEFRRVLGERTEL